MKVIMLFGVIGACRCDELLHINGNDIEDYNTHIVVHIPHTKTTKPRVFTIVDDFYISIYRKYSELRPDNMTGTRFFIKYENGCCHRTVMGIHKMSSIPKEVASYLKLENPSDYTGHSLRRTSATFSANSKIEGTNVNMIMTASSSGEIETNSISTNSVTFKDNKASCQIS